MRSRTGAFFRSRSETSAANVSPVGVKEGSAGCQEDARDHDSENRSFDTASPILGHRIYTEGHAHNPTQSVHWHTGIKPSNLALFLRYMRHIIQQDVDLNVKSPDPPSRKRGISYIAPFLFVALI